MMSNSKKRFVALLAAGAFSVGAVASELTYKSHNRLINTEDAITVPTGSFEVTGGAAYTNATGRRVFNNDWGIKTADKIRVYDWSLTARYGVADDLDVFLSTGWVDIKDRNMQVGDSYGRGIDDLTVGAKYVIWRDREDFSVAWQPSLMIPVYRQHRVKDGRLAAGRSFWSFDNTLAATRNWACFSGSMAVTQTIPFAEGRYHFSRPFMMAREKTRGTTAVDMGMVYTDFPVQPLVELNYIHEWISSGPDSDLLSTTMGARVAVPGVGQLMAGVQYPLAGRNSYRGTTLSMGLTAEF